MIRGQKLEINETVQITNIKASRDNLHYSHHSLVVRSTESSDDKGTEKEDNLPEIVPTVPRIYQKHIQSNVRNRFANTTVVSKVRNLAQKSQEATFSIVLPETAFISGFIIEVGGKNYTANQGCILFDYEELLKRQDGHYKQIINIHPGQTVKDLGVEVVIKESRKIKDLKAAPFRSENEIGDENSELDPRADIEIVNDKTAIVRFSPNIERQKQIAHLLGTDGNKGLAGQFVVQYDVERDPQGGEVLVQDGYFVHFFAPTDLAPLPKHVTNFCYQYLYCLAGWSSSGELARTHKSDEVDRQSILVFLTDGEPTDGLRSDKEITNKVCLLSTLQISSPLLANVNFKYELSVTSLIKTEFPIHFGGSELVFCGFYRENELKPPVIEAFGERGRISLKPLTIERSVSNIESLWAYLTIKQLLEKKEVADQDKNELKEKALDLALKYSFVTPVSSLVVVKPNVTNAVDTEEASEGRPRSFAGAVYSRGSGRVPNIMGGLFFGGSAPSAYGSRAVVPLSSSTHFSSHHINGFEMDLLPSLSTPRIPTVSSKPQYYVPPARSTTSRSTSTERQQLVVTSSDLLSILP
ncbi:hypothetical protein ILUMI_24657 [Ignelater luminosus]|uniref:VIT domain-containing protein n=1 Tax=Ignelater luminosus TaxID=2038154 RepID=A0A8K0CBH5_IGNLU|nr:hypothetical protein ILUMI_24657 [Ignelater luminosus]